MRSTVAARALRACAIVCLCAAAGACARSAPAAEQGSTPDGAALFAGGTPFTGPWGTVYSTNITSHLSAGIGAYSNDDLVRIFREGRNRAGRALWVMPWSASRNLSDEDLNSLIAALRQVPPNPNLVPAPALKQAN